MTVERIEAVGESGRTHRCTNCGWHGAPTYVGGVATANCPVCSPTTPEIPKGSGRNRPCACGSGKKAKKCCAR